MRKVFLLTVLLMLPSLTVASPPQDMLSSLPPGRDPVAGATAPTQDMLGKLTDCNCQSNPCSDASCQAYGGSGLCECRKPIAKSKPKSKRVEIHGLWYDQYEDGSIVPCEECNKGKVPSWRQGAVYVPTVEGRISFPHFNQTAPMWQGVPQGLPFVVQGQPLPVLTPITNVTGAVPLNTPYPAFWGAAGTPTPAGGAGMFGTTSVPCVVGRG